MISEGQQFEYLGFELNPVVRKAIMRKDLLFIDLEAVTEMIAEYNKIVTNLTASEAFFLKSHLFEAETIIQAGLGRYNWKTLNIQKFCEKCLVILKSLTAMVAQISYISTDIKNRIIKIESYSLFTFENKKVVETTIKFDLIIKSSLQKSTASNSVKHEDDSVKKKSISFPSDDEGLLPCKEYFQKLISIRDEKTGRIKKLYDSIGPILIKLESLILGTYSGESDKMILYYEHWEKEAFACLIRFCNKNLNEIAENLISSNPLYTVEASLSSPEIVLKPSTSEIYNIVIHSVKDFLER